MLETLFPATTTSPHPRKCEDLLHLAVCLSHFVADSGERFCKVLLGKLTETDVKLLDEADS